MSCESSIPHSDVCEKLNFSSSNSPDIHLMVENFELQVLLQTGQLLFESQDPKCVDITQPIQKSFNNISLTSFFYFSAKLISFMFNVLEILCFPLLLLFTQVLLILQLFFRHVSSNFNTYTFALRSSYCRFSGILATAKFIF
jgi:hypothetical protein